MLIKLQKKMMVSVCALIYFIINPAMAEQTPRWQTQAQPIFISPLAGTTQIEGAIVSVAEDANGFMWFVARNGLWRWDSQSLTPAKFVTSSAKATRPEAQVIYSDKSGGLWLGTKRGLFQYDLVNNKFIEVGNEQVSEVSIENIIVSESNGETLVFLAGDRTLFQFNPANSTLTEIDLPEPTRIHALHIDNSNSLWVGTTKGLYFAKKIHEQPLLLDSEQALEGIRISAFHSTIKDELWIGTATQGYFIRDGQGQFEQMWVETNGTQPWLYAMAEVGPHLLWMGTFGEGIIEIDTKTRSQRQFRNNRLQPAALSDDNVWTMYRDTRGLIWVATANGLNVFDSSQTAIKQIYGGLNTGQGLKQNTIHSVNAYEEQLLVGTGLSGIEVLDPYQGSNETLWASSTSAVETLYTAPDGSVYGSGNFTSVRVHTEDTSVSNLGIAGRADNSFSTAFAKTTDSLWVGGTDGLWRQELAGDESTIEIFSNDAGERRIASLLVTNDYLWVGLWRGLAKVNLTSAFNSPEITFVEHPVLSEQFISSMHMDQNKQLWVGTSGVGIYVLRNDQSWQQITVEDGLPGNVVSAIHSDKQGIVWVSSTRGIAAIDPITKQITSVVLGSMSVNSPYIRGAVAYTDYDEMVFGGTNGLTIINTSDIDTTLTDLSLVLTTEEVIAADGNQQILKPNIERLIVNPLAQRVSFEFVALEFLNPQHVYYRYRLLGLEKTWTEVDADHRNVSYTTLAPGSYTLEIQYSRDGIVWKDKTLSRHLLVEPAWYQIKWVQLIGLLILCVLILVGHCMGLRQYRKQKQVLEVKVAERTADLIAANQQLSTQAQALKDASLTDALTGLRNRRFLSQNIEDDIAMLNRHYDDCQRNSKSPDNDSDLLFFLVDLDYFKKINDKWGHQAGDAVLIEMRKRLEKVFRVVDYLIRWGGEEFLIVARHTSRGEASAIAERISKVVREEPFKVHQGEIQKVTCSLGYAAYPFSKEHFDLLSWQETIALADTALYEAKNNNRDTWKGFANPKQNATKDMIKMLKTRPQSVFEVAELSQPK